MPKNKYFVVLTVTANHLLVAGLPTSKDHIPAFITKKHGCINDDSLKISCYFFEKDQIVSECGKFAFPLDTYIYGEQIDVIEENKLNSLYKQEHTDYEIVCTLSTTELTAIKQCLKNSTVVKHKIKKML